MSISVINQATEKHNPTRSSQLGKNPTRSSKGPYGPSGMMPIRTALRFMGETVGEKSKRIIRVDQ